MTRASIDDPVNAQSERGPFMVSSIEYDGQVCSKTRVNRSPALRVSDVKHDDSIGASLIALWLEETS